MSTLKFKTNIKCDGCVAKVTPGLDANSRIESWKVDLTSPEKLLTVEGDEVTASEVVESLAGAGYRAEQV